MNLNLNFLLFLISFIFSCNVEAQLSNSSWESIEKWTEVCVKGAQANNVSSAIEVISALGKAIPYAGPFAAVLAAVLSNYSSSEKQQIKDKLDALNRKLDAIDRHIGKVILQIEPVAIEAQYKSEVKYLRNLKKRYQRFIRNPTNITRHDFHLKCGHLSAIEFLHYIEREVNDEEEAELLPLRREMLNNFKVHSWSGRIAAILADATFLHFTCIGASGFSVESINSTLEGPDGDKAIFKRLLEQISAGIQKMYLIVEKKFFRHAKGEVDNYLSEYSRKSHQEFADLVYGKLSDKYDFRDWLVFSWSRSDNKDYNYETIGSRPDINNTSVNYWNNIENRSLIVAAARPEDRSLSSFVARRDHCLLANEYDRSSAYKIAELLMRCIYNCEILTPDGCGNSNNQILAVVWASKGGLRNASEGAASQYFINAVLDKWTYTIIAFPEPNFLLSNFSNKYSGQPLFTSADRKSRSPVDWSNFFKHATEEVEHYLAAYKNKSHAEFAQVVQNYLSTNYSFCDWFVASWSAGGEYNHWVAQSTNANSKYWMNVEGRDLVVAAAPKHLSVGNFVAQRNRCLLTSNFDRSNAKSIGNCLMDCLSTKWKLLAVVWKGGFEAYYSNTTKYYYDSVVLRKWIYAIIAIPYDNTVFLSQSLSNSGVDKKTDSLVEKNQPLSNSGVDKKPVEKSEFFKHATDDVEHYLRTYKSSDHQKFAKIVIDELIAKYPFRNWYVRSWSKDSDEGDQWVSQSMNISFNANFKYWDNVEDRCLVVAAALPKLSIKSFVAQRDHCLVRYLGRNSAKSIVKHLESCLNTKWEFLAVVWGGGGKKSSFTGAASQYFTTTAVDSWTYSVIAIPHKNSVFAANFSNQIDSPLFNSSVDKKTKSTVEKSEFFEQAKNDVDYYLNAYKGKNHSEFAKIVFYKLETKYPFCDWFVHSWSKDKDYQWVSQSLDLANANFKYWDSEKSRCLIVTAAPRNLSVNSFVARRDHCLLTFQGRSSTMNIVKHLENCLNTKWELLAATYERRDAVWYTGSTSQYFIQATVGKWIYHITAIPYKNSVFSFDVNNQINYPLLSPRVENKKTNSTVERSAFFKQAISEVNHYLGVYRDKDHEEFARIVHQKLSDMYPFRDWFVASWPTSSLIAFFKFFKPWNDWVAKSSNANSEYWISTQGRDLIVAAAPKNLSVSNLVAQRDHCLLMPDYNRKSAKSIGSHLRGCINTKLEMLAVVYTFRFNAFFQGTTSHYYDYVALQEWTYAIIAIPYENTAASFD